MDVVPLYEVTHPRCIEPVGTISTSNSCRAYQADVDNCSNTCLTGQFRVRECDGTCGCSFFILCPIGVICDPRSGAPLCPNQPIYAYGLSP